MILLDGKKLSQKILSDLRLKIVNCKLKINLHVILVGNNSASQKYVTLKEDKCREVGVNFVLHHLPENTTQNELLSLISDLNQNPKVTGFFIQLPLSPHLKKSQILSSINPQKDVDGLNPASSFTPAVVIGIVNLLDHYHLNFTDKKIVIVNDSDLIGKPLKKHYPQAVLCNDRTSDLSVITKTADLLISATGVKNLITADMVKTNAVVVDAAGGDVDFIGVSPKCSYITPTFGGVGPMTVASLLYNLSQV